MKLLLLVIACLGVVQCQKRKFVVEKDTSSVDVIVQSASKTIEDLSPEAEALQTNLATASKDTKALKSSTSNISKDAVDKLNDIVNDVIATAKEIEKLSGATNKTCSTAAVNASNTLQTNRSNDVNACVKPLNEINNILKNITEIETQLEELRNKTTLTSLQGCVPKTNTTFNFFETVKIKQCLNNIVYDYKRFLSEKTSTVNNIQTYVGNLSGSGLSTINECINKVVSSTKSSADTITNTMIKCSDIIPKFLSNVTNNINAIKSTAGANVEKQLSVILNYTNNSLDILTNLTAASKEKLDTFKQYITDAIETLKPYTNENFINEEALQGNIFATIESQIEEKVKSIIDKELSLYNDTLTLYNKLKDITSAALPENLQNCLLPEGKSSTATVECLTGISSAYIEGIKSLEEAAVKLANASDTAKQDVVDVIRYATKKVEKLAVTTKDTAEFLYDKSGLEVTVLVKDSLQLLLSSDKNSVHITISQKFNALVTEYSKIEAFIGKVRATVPEKVKITGQPIQQAIELLAIVDPTKDYGVLYNQSLTVITEAETKIYNAIDEYLTKGAENLFVQIGELSDNYNVRIRVDNSSGLACINKEDVFFTCVVQCLRNISKASGKYFQFVVDKLDKYLAQAVDLPNSANATLTLAIQEIIQSSINTSTKLAGKAFRVSNMTVEEFFTFVGREIKVFNKTLMPQLMEIGDTILDNAAKVYDKQFATLQKVGSMINNISEKVNIAIDDIIFIYSSAPINNKTLVAITNAAIERIYKTFNVVVLPATNLTELGKLLKEKAVQIFLSVSESALKAKCKDIYPVLEDSIACLSKEVNNMAEEINTLTQRLYAVNEDAVTVRNDARETLNENITAEMTKLQADSLDMANSYYLHYGVTNESMYAKAIQTVQKLTAQNARTLDYNLNFLLSFVTQMQGKEDRAKYEVNRLIQSSVAYLGNAISSVRYLGGIAKAVTFHPELLQNLTNNATKIVEPYMPKYSNDTTYYTELYKNIVTENASLAYYGSVDNFNKTCRADPVYTRCVRNIANNFVSRMTEFLKTTTQLQVNGSALLLATENALKSLLNGIVANVTNYNLEYSKPIAENLYRDGNLTVESLFRVFVTQLNNTYQTMIPSIVRLGAANKKLVESVVSTNFFLAYPIQSNIEQLVNSVTSAFKLAIAMSDGLTMDNEGVKAQQYGDDIIKKYKNFTESLRTKAVELGDKSNAELSLALSYAGNFSIKYLNDTCKPYTYKYPTSEANMCGNTEKWMSEVNTKNRLNAITSYNSDLTTLNNTALAQAQDYGSKLTEEFRSYTLPVIKKLNEWAEAS